jgi:hypothetical protein
VILYIEQMFNTLNAIQIPELWQLLISVVTSVVLVYLIEWIKQPIAKISQQSDLNLRDGRKFIKVKVNVKKNFLGDVFPWQNPASFAILKGELIDICDKKETVLFNYAIKWDSNPEPLEYLKNGKQRLKHELLPSVSAPRNFLAGEEDSASVAVKHPGEQHFYAYDGNYYVNPKVNTRDEKKVILRITFSSSSASAKKDFLIINSNTTTDSFSLKEVK